MIFRSKVQGCSHLVIALLCATSAPAIATPKQLLTPEACTTIRYLAQDEVTDHPPLRISRDGTRIAYVLQVPDIPANKNSDQLYVAPVEHNSVGHSTPILINDLITAVNWFPDNRTLAALMRVDGTIALVQVDSITKSQHVIWRPTEGISDYSMNATGDTIAVAVTEHRQVLHPSDNQHDERAGYRIDLASTAHSEYPRRQVYVLHRSYSGHWEVSKPIRFVSPLSGKMIGDIVDDHVMHISLSPNGNFLLMDNIEKFADVPSTSSWAQDYGVKYERNRGSVGLLVTYLFDLKKNRASLPLESPYVWYSLWAPDSKSYMTIALAPVGSTWEAADFEHNTPTIHMTHLFSVDIYTGKVDEVLNRADNPPVAWTKAGNVIVRDPENRLITLHRESDQWKQTATAQIPFADGEPYSPLTSDGTRVAMEYENAGTAPQIVAFDLNSGKSWLIAKLDPQVDNLALPRTKEISWTTTTGYTAKGLLLLPPDYDPHNRYPLVIENGSVLYDGGFVCDSGVTHVSSFARGIIADAGIAYLMRYWPGINDWETNYYPKGYPGHLAEAAFKQDLAESAVRTLDQRGIIDPTKVGLLGFSRGGWYVEYMLTHSHMHFEAASATDNVLYSLGDYWYWNTEQMARAAEGVYGGPPYGSSLKNWLDYSISFNLDKIHTALLMEVNGYGEKYDRPDQPPDNLAVHNEVFVGLSRLHKPVEYYYYPNEQHEPEHPQARIASLQRNVDWFRFWLQGYERPDPEDPKQYERWRRLRLGAYADAKNNSARSTAASAP